MSSWSCCSWNSIWFCLDFIHTAMPTYFYKTHRYVIIQDLQQSFIRCLRWKILNVLGVWLHCKACIITVIWCCRQHFNQWQQSFEMKYALPLAKCIPQDLIAVLSTILYHVTSLFQVMLLNIIFQGIMPCKRQLTDHEKYYFNWEIHNFLKQKSIDMYQVRN